MLYLHIGMFIFHCYGWLQHSDCSTRITILMSVRIVCSVCTILSDGFLLKVTETLKWI